MSSAYEQSADASTTHAAHAAAPVETAPPAQGHGLVDQIAHVAASGLGALEHAGQNLSGGVDEKRGPALNGFWNHLFGGPGAEAGDGRPLTQNHIGSQTKSPVVENDNVSKGMRDTPYLGDYWEALSVTHDSAHIKNPILNGATAISNVALPGPLMGLVDAPFRAFGHSLFLDDKSLKK